MAVAATILSTAGNARAAVQTYVDKTDFFNNVAPGYYFETFTSDKGKTVLNGQLFSFGGYSFTLADSGTAVDYSTGAGAEVSIFPRVMTAGESFVLTFPSDNVTAFGGTFFATDSSFIPVAGVDISVTLSTGQTIDLDSTSTYKTEPFAGFTSSIPIESVTITAPDDLAEFLALDSLYLGTTDFVPEPTTWALMLGGLGLLLAVRRFRTLRSMGSLAAAAAAICLFCSAAPIKAQVIEYDDQDAFQNNLDSGAYFESFGMFNGDIVPEPQSFSLGGDDFTLTTAGGEGIGYSSTTGVGATGSAAQASVFPSTDFSDETMTVTFGPGITAFSANFFLVDESYDSIPGDVTITLSTGQSVTLSSTDNYSTQPFEGFTSDVPFDSFTITTSDEDAFVAFDNFYLGQSDTDVPEPSAWALMLGGLGLVGLRFWSKRNRQASR